jgi:hypothetical protein
MKNPEVFEGKSFQDILKEIHGHSASKRKEIKTLMETLADMINTPHDAAIVAPLVREFLEVAVKNDEALVKIAVIIQRLMTAEATATGSGIDELLSEDDKQKLLDEVKESQDEANKSALEELAQAVEKSDETEALAEKTKEVVNQVNKRTNVENNTDE